jgi:hypothetical protein
MTKHNRVFAGLAMLTLAWTCAAQSPGTVPVQMVVTVEPLNEGDTTVADLSRDGVQVRLGSDTPRVTGWIPSRGEAAGLQLFILIDDTSDTSLGSQLDEIRRFIEAQPATTWIAVGYMRNAVVGVTQNFTTDHAQAAKMVRLPLGSSGASDSAYQSLIGLLKAWPGSKMRREVLMVTDGIDRTRGSGSSPQRSSGLGLPSISPDVDRASLAAQRDGVIVHSIYSRGVGRFNRNTYQLQNGQNSIAKLADETGGECFFQGIRNPVSFKPYLDRLQTILDNQYLLTFNAIPSKNGELQRVRISTEVPKVEVVAADNVWVPAGQN